MLNNCCFCISLENGGKTIAILTIVGSIIELGKIFFGAADNRAVASEETSVSIVSNVLGLVIAVCLLVGIIKKRHNLILAWLIYTVIAAIFGIGIIIFLLSTIDLKDSNGILVVIIIVVLLIYALTVYFWLVICALYKKVKAENVRPEYQTRNFNPNYCPNEVKYISGPNGAQYPVGTNAAINTNVV